VEGEEEQEVRVSMIVEAAAVVERRSGRNS
jgi:hypothetical protein